MKITFQDQYTIAQEISGLTDSSSLTRFKRDINTGGALFLARLGREFNRKSRTTNIVASQQYYQLPEDGQRLKEAIYVQSSSYSYPLEQIPDEGAWRKMNIFAITGIPTHYFIRGYDEIGLYPIPAAAVTNGLELVFSPRHLELTEADTTSTTSSTTITVTNGSQTITNSGTALTAKMVGQWLEITDGTDSDWYRISAFTNTSTVTIENYYQGSSGSGKSFRIGQIMDMPEEYLEAPVDYAMYRHFLRRGSHRSRYGAGAAADFKTLFDTSLQLAKEDYSQTTDSQVINAEPTYRTYNPFRGDPPASISA